MNDSANVIERCLISTAKYLRNKRFDNADDVLISLVNKYGLETVRSNARFVDEKVWKYLSNWK